MSFRYSCSYCGCDDAQLHPFHFEDVCAECNGYLDKIHMCETCETWPTFDGIDECIHCFADAVIADPGLLDGCARSLQVEIAKVLAARIRPMLSVRQAA